MAARSNLLHAARAGWPEGPPAGNSVHSEGTAASEVAAAAVPQPPRGCDEAASLCPCGAAAVAAPAAAAPAALAPAEPEPQASVLPDPATVAPLDLSMRVRPPQDLENMRSARGAAVVEWPCNADGHVDCSTGADDAEALADGATGAPARLSPTGARRRGASAGAAGAWTRRARRPAAAAGAQSSSPVRHWTFSGGRWQRICSAGAAAEPEAAAASAGGGAFAAEARSTGSGATASGDEAAAGEPAAAAADLEAPWRHDCGGAGAADPRGDAGAPGRLSGLFDSLSPVPKLPAESPAGQPRTAASALRRVVRLASGCSARTSALVMATPSPLRDTSDLSLSEIACSPQQLQELESEKRRLLAEYDLVLGAVKAGSLCAAGGTGSPEESSSSVSPARSPASRVGALRAARAGAATQRLLRQLHNAEERIRDLSAENARLRGEGLHGFAGPGRS